MMPMSVPQSPKFRHELGPFGITRAGSTEIGRDTQKRAE